MLSPTPTVTSRFPESSCLFESMLISITERIAPVDAMATRPKLSFSDAFESFLREATPWPIARMNGTVSAPVVAPDASNYIARNSLDVITAIPNIIR